MADLGILASYAHPDDEQGVTGTLALYAQQGVRTGLICATRGELGEISDPALATPETLGAVREQEMRTAAAIAQIQHVWFLDYRDSGFVNSPRNQDPEAFANADPEEVVGRIVRIIRMFKPQVIVTFDPTGGYGHADHIAISRWTTDAFHAAGDATRFPEAGPAWAPARLYYAALPRSFSRRLNAFIRKHIPESSFAGLDLDQMGLPDEEVTNVVDVSNFVALKRDSVRAHATQWNPAGPFARVSEEMTNQWRGKESFMLAAGPPPPPGADSGDLFAGLR
jgi:LmbE family N-acetylglucosaminyl deacetylase